jgi:hypothetical protein
MAKPNKFDQAVAKVRGTEALATTDAPQTLGQIGSEGIAGLVRRADAGSLAARLKAGEIESAPQLLTLEEGTEMTVTVLSEGKTEIEDLNKSGSMKEVTVWILQMLDPDTFDPGPKVSILGSAQLDRQLRTLVGKVAIIARGGEVRTSKGRKMTEYFVGEVKRK